MIVIVIKKDANLTHLMHSLHFECLHSQKLTVDGH